MHAEYTALSQALYQVLPLQKLMSDSLKVLVPDRFASLVGPVMKSKVFEDNNGALILASTHRLTPRTRWYNCRLHHFWEAVDNDEVRVERIDTTKQDADYLTKSLAPEPFRSCRRRNQGV